MHRSKTVVLVPLVSAALGSLASTPPSQFAARFENGALVSLQRAGQTNAVEYVARGKRLGDVALRYRVARNDWQVAETAALRGTVAETTSQAEPAVTYDITNGTTRVLRLRVRFLLENNSIRWILDVANLSNEPIEIGDFALPLPISRGGRQRDDSGATNDPGPVILKHSFISGHGSFLYWMRSDLVGPHLELVPVGDTKLEYWEGSREGGYRVFMHSAAAGVELKARGSTWRLPHTSLKLAPKGKSGSTQTYQLKFRWADDDDAVRQILVDEGGVDVHVVPGMTVPTDLVAQLALRTQQKIQSIEPEFPGATEIKSLGTHGDYRLYQVQFSKLGENRITINYGRGSQMFLEFFCTEPLETLIKKRAAFLARSQHRDATKWYNGLITDWNMQSQKLLSPDDYAPIPRNRYYAVTCDDPGLGKPAFLAAKNAEFPEQKEVEALDYYIKHFVWGGLQRTSEEKYSYAIYGIPDWKTNRESLEPGRTGQLHFWREYDYPHVIQMYFAMYRLAKNHPEIKTALTAKEYLRRAYGTANAFFTIPHEVWSGWSPYGTGFYNELVIVDLIDELQLAGMNTEAETLRGFWERKVRSFVSGRQDLFRSEYAFDTTGFESTHALAKYAMAHVDPPGVTNAGVSQENARRFLEKQMAANLFCRGCIEPAYYCLGSDYRGGGGNAYTLTYMSQMGGWSVLDYGLNFATNPAPYLRLGYASYLSAWALMNSGTADSNYGYWYPGVANDGAAGGGFEPSANGRMWLVPNQVLGRGSWFFSSEIDLGYCGALRSAVTVLTDDPIFGRCCLGGEWRNRGNELEVIPKDGLHRRFHARLNNGSLTIILDADRFAPAQPVSLKVDLSEIRFRLEDQHPDAHSVKLTLQASAPGKYKALINRKPITSFELKSQREATVILPLARETTALISISKAE